MEMADSMAALCAAESSVSPANDFDIAATIRRRLEAAGTPYMANDNIASAIQDESELALLIDGVEKAAEKLLDALVIDTKRDHNTRETARRIARMYIKEVFSGRYQPAPACTEFPNTRQLEEIYTLGPISVRSACSHHLVPIVGKLWIGVLPAERIMGISKFSRLANWVLCRPHIQEESVMILADELEKRLAPRGLAVMMRAQHMCMTWRGVREESTSMVNSVLRGTFLHDIAARDEFMKIITAQGF